MTRKSGFSVHPVNHFFGHFLGGPISLLTVMNASAVAFPLAHGG
jgi:hypothetical protein